MKRLLLYLRTARYLRGRQIAWFIYRRLRPTTSVRARPAETQRARLRPVVPARPPQPERAEFRFLNVAAEADPATVDWHPGDKSRLWRYNLHYFDYLLWDCLEVSDKRRFVDDWIARNPMGTVDAWEPYCVSLRIVNWIKYALGDPDTARDSRFADSLFIQSRWLSRNLELHILANHFLKNAKALVFAGVWFGGPEGRRFLALGLRLWRAQLDEQILPDGGHYERSPMYHSIVLEDCLDVLNMLQALRALDASDECVEDAILHTREAAGKALAFLEDIARADGRIPLFNDSAHGIAPPPDALRAFAERLSVAPDESVSTLPRLVERRASGYYGYAREGESLLIDCGPVGPDYQPGHAHCDCLSFELCIDGTPLVVDSGVYSYEPGSLRAALRGTAAHNTVAIDGVEQSEIWGTFRVARRAQPLGAQVFLEGDRFVFEGAHDGYTRLPERVVHRRRIEVSTGREWLVRDRLEGEGRVAARSTIHLAPDVDVHERAGGRLSLVRAGREVATLAAGPGVQAVVATGPMAPEFGRLEDHAIVALECEGDLPLQLEYRIARTVGSV